MRDGCLLLAIGPILAIAYLVYILWDDRPAKRRARRHVITPPVVIGERYNCLFRNWRDW